MVRIFFARFWLLLLANALLNVCNCNYRVHIEEPSNLDAAASDSTFDSAFADAAVDVAQDTAIDSASTGINPAPDENAAQSGAAYVFTRVGSTWTQQAFIKASNAGIHDRFGWSVAVSRDGNTMAVGSIGEDTSTGGINPTPNEDLEASGALYVFTRIGTTWTEQAFIKTSNPSGEHLHA